MLCTVQWFVIGRASVLSLAITPYQARPTVVFVAIAEYALKTMRNHIMLSEKIKRVEFLKRKIKSKRKVERMKGLLSSKPTATKRTERKNKQQQDKIIKLSECFVCRTNNYNLFWFNYLASKRSAFPSPRPIERVSKNT